MGWEKIKIRADGNELENKYSTEKISQSQSWLFGRTNKIKQLSGKIDQEKKRTYKETTLGMIRQIARSLAET